MNDDERPSPKQPKAANERLERFIEKRLEERDERECHEREREPSDAGSGLEYADDVSDPTPTAVVEATTASVSGSCDKRGDHQNATQASSSGQRKGPVEVSIPWDDDIVQDGDMSHYGFIVHRSLHILICIGCKTVVDPKEIHSHMHDCHPHIRITKDYCESLKKRFSLTPKADLVRMRPPLRRAIPCLELKEGLVRCTGCNRAMEHERSFLGAHSCDQFTIVGGVGQAFFPHQHHGGFFGVTVPTRQREEQPVDLVQAIKAAFPDPRPANVPITLPLNPRDAHHFLATQDWISALDNLTGAQIRFAVREVNKPLRLLVSGAINRYIARVAEVLRVSTTHSARVAMGSYTGLVFIPRPIPLETTDETNREMWTTDVFKPLREKSTQRIYGDCGTDLVTFVVGACRDELGELHVETTDEQKALAKRFLDHLLRRDGSEQSPLQDLLYSVFTEYLANRPPQALLAYRFLILYSFRHDGSIQLCNNITQIISREVFFGRGSMLFMIKSIMDREKRGFHS